MNTISSIGTLNKLRGYSAIYSTKSFAKLLNEDDYTFINANIYKYDHDKVGKSIISYYDYIKYTYQELRKKYRNEYFYKNTFINDLLLDKYGVKDTIAISEFRVGNSIADIVLFNGTSKAFEIKTELDSNRRLNSQLADYTKIFKESYIITHESLVEKYLQENENIGIIQLIEHPKSVSLCEVRHARENKLLDSNTIIRSIRTSEYKNIVLQYFGKLPEMNSFNMFETCKIFLKNIPNDKLNFLFINELKKRKSNTEIIGTYHKELRQLCLAMNMSAMTYAALHNKLSKTVKL